MLPIQLAEVVDTVQAKITKYFRRYDQIVDAKINSMLNSCCALKVYVDVYFVMSFTPNT